MLSVAAGTLATQTGNALERLLARGRTLCDGAMGTMLYDSGVAYDRCFEELNLSQPETVASIHMKYLRAGAEIIETNTFGGNAFRLDRHGLRVRVREINLAGVRIARDCVAQTNENQTVKACVAGAIGPLGVYLEQLGLDHVRAVFAEQISALAEGGPGIGADLLMIETMTSLGEAGEAIRAAQEVAPALHLVVMMTIDGQGNCLDGSPAEWAAAKLTELGASSVGCNCSDGPETVLRAIERMRGATHLPIAAMPNAGLPNAVAGRGVYGVSPAELAGFVPRFIQAGASMIGGCCGTTPDHIRAMNLKIRTIQ